MFLEFLRWWYGQGWLKAAKACTNWSTSLLHIFSIQVLLSTLFSPWKRIVASPGRSMDEKMRGIIDNLTSRAVGFFVRIATLLIAGVMLIFSFAAGVVVALLWPLLPVLAVYLLFRGVVG